MQFKIHIIIPCRNDIDYTIDFIESIKQKSYYEHYIHVIADSMDSENKNKLDSIKIEYQPVNFKSFFKTIQFGISNDKIKLDELIMITNSDLLVSENWDINLLNSFYKENVEACSPSLILDLIECGWKPPINTDPGSGLYMPNWFQKERGKLDKNLFYNSTKELSNIYKKKYILHRLQLIPQVMNKHTFFQKLNGQNFQDIGDMGFYNRFSGTKILIALDSWVYHYVERSLPQLKNDMFKI